MALLPDSIVLHIFSYLDHKSILHVSLVCKQWWRIAYDELLWKKRFLSDFKLPTRTTIPYCTSSGWYSEYRRLTNEIPSTDYENILFQEVITHVVFSNEGLLFITCSDSGSIQIWASAYPCTLLFEDNLRQNHQLTSISFAQFNVDDTLLLLSCRTEDNRGKIIVFDVDNDGKLTFRSQVQLNSSRMFNSCWYSSECFLSMTKSPLNGYSDVSLHLAIKTDEEIIPETKLFRFLNFHDNEITMPLISGHVSNWVKKAIGICEKVELSYKHDQHFNTADEIDAFRTFFAESSDEKKLSDDDGDKMLIFTMGTDKENISHQIGFKLIKNLSPNLVQDEIGLPFLDFPDRFIDLKGHIIGISLSVDERFVYATVRPWVDGNLERVTLENYVEIRIIDMERLNLVNSVTYLGPVAWQMDSNIFVSTCGTSLTRLHAGCCDSGKWSLVTLFSDNYTYTIFNFSGSESNFAFVWDRHYSKMEPHKLTHNDMVTCAVFNPKNNEMIVTASKSRHMKIWRSKRFIRELKV